MKISFHQTGEFTKTQQFFSKILKKDYMSVLGRYGAEGVRALSGATPHDSGNTAAAWSYEITDDGNEVSISFLNSNINKGVNIAIILQYGHGTGTGGYVAGRDYINPAIRPVFDKMANDAWKEIIS